MMRKRAEVSAAWRHAANAYEEVLEALGKALDLRDTETAGHSYRVRRYSVEIASKMECTPRQVRDVGWGARLHDIGKIGIPDSILFKPGKLTMQEREVMSTHCWLGYNLLHPLRKRFHQAVEIVLAHHERFDGGGYPYGLKGRQIPLGARIFSVADALDAITTDRPYRRALPLSYAYDEITRERDKQFDGQVADAFQSIPETLIREIILSEKRRTVRLPLRTSVDCWRETKVRRVVSVDISQGGMLLKDGTAFALGQTLRLRFRLPDSPAALEPRGVAVRRVYPRSVGVQFQGISSCDRRYLESFIAQHTQIAIA